jgi:hypothetical protein
MTTSAPPLGQRRASQATSQQLLALLAFWFWVSHAAYRQRWRGRIPALAALHDHDDEGL